MDIKWNKIQIVKEIDNKEKGETRNYDQDVLEDIDIKKEMDMMYNEVDFKKEVANEEEEIKNCDKNIFNDINMEETMNRKCYEMEIKKETVGTEGEEDKMFYDNILGNINVKTEIDVKHNDIQIEIENEAVIQNERYDDIPIDVIEKGNGSPLSDSVAPSETFSKEDIDPVNVDRRHVPKFANSNKHMKLHSVHGSVTCKACDVEFTSKQSLNKHMMSHCIVTDKRHGKCGDKKTYKLQYLLINHTDMRKNIKFVCNICDRFFTTLYNLQCHLATHNNTKEHACNNCGKSIESNFFHRHFKTYSVFRSFTCNICKESFQTIKHISLHLISHSHFHINYECLICRNLFESKYNLLRHIENHKEVGIYTCEICKKSFNVKNDLSRHLREHQPQSFSCKICNDSLKSEFSLFRHLRRHNILHSSSKFFCNFCGMNFNTLNYILRHMSIHNKIGNFTCHICEKSYTTRWKLSRHTKIHENKKMCNVCYKVYTGNDSLKLHAQNHLSIKENTCKVCFRPFDDFSNLYNHVLDHVFSE